MFVIVNVGTELTYHKPRHITTATYETVRGAKGACTKLNKNYGNCGQWVVMSIEDYCNAYPVKMVQKTNLMSGNTYMEAEDTPNCCSPASETYWSM